MVKTSNNSLIQAKILNLPTQSHSHTVSQHFRPSKQLLSSVQNLSFSSGHSLFSASKVGHMPGAENRF